MTALTSLVNELAVRRLVIESAELVRPAVGRPISLLEMDTGHWAVVGMLCDRQRLSIAMGGLDGVVRNMARHPVPGNGPAGIDACRP